MANPKLLIIDDDAGIRAQLKWGLDDFDVITADSRQMAIEQLEFNQPPLVTLDLGLPPDVEGTSEGFAILQAILERAPNTKVVVVSGSDEKINSQKAIKNGAFEFFAKPVDVVQLRLILERAYTDYQSLK